ncbi:MAG: MBL fold metallo-hydrolase RNA specificity domain-containing protein [Aquificaceae bacterium]|uniref:MBL fold metallo-hydrolase RNA specificity domain-containing protein n=1 Tax=Hydrogenobacter sp. Uz 6-8 TaxID=3384828 RepID=UPI0030ADC19B
MKVIPYGGAKTVTGSCFYVEARDVRLLIDCGMFQGLEERRNHEPFPFDPKEIDYLVLTHAHIDHCGRVPVLVKEGFRGKVISTEPTAKLSRLMLLDASKVMYENYKTALKKLQRTGRVPEPPLYEEYDVLEAMEFFRVRLPYNQDYRLSKGVSLRLRDSGHILGSAFVELEVYEDKRHKRVIFSGDLGNKNKPIVHDPESPSPADYIFIESTYGDRNHRSFEESKEELLQAIQYAIGRGGNVIIPSYALERAQEILYVLREFHEEGRLPKCEIFLDSPLAISITRLFTSHPEFYDRETYRVFLQRNPFELPNLHYTKEVDESKAINSVGSGAVIIAGSGMLNGGRVLHHLKYNLWREECAIVFVGYQPQGTLGRRIIEGAESVRVFGEEIAVRARVFTINGFSSHADQAGLLEWLSYAGKPERVFLIHGEEEKMKVFGGAIKEKLGLSSHTPELGEVLEL